MRYDSENHHRRSIRLEGYDYSRAGAYFVTICTRSRVYLFGEIVNGKMILNDAGHMVVMVWNALPRRFDCLELDEFVIMPNHIHGIIVLSGGPPRRGESCIRPVVRPNDRVRPNSRDRIFPKTPPNGGVDNGNQGEYHDKGEYKIRPYTNAPNGHDNAIHDHSAGTLPDTLGRIIQAFKSITTNAYINGVKQSGWPPFAGVVWQRNYWEHVVRNEPELNQIRAYIRHNPAQWDLDKLNKTDANDAREPIIGYAAQVWMI